MPFWHTCLEGLLVDWIVKNMGHFIIEFNLVFSMSKQLFHVSFANDSISSRKTTSSKPAHMNIQ